MAGGGQVIRFRPLRPRQRRYLRHWAMELAVVVFGVLIALWANEWVQGRRDAATHAETLERLDASIRRVQVFSAVRVATADCLKARIAELDAALVGGDGAWTGMPLALPEAMTRHRHFPLVYVADGISVPTNLFALAEDNGTLPALPPAPRRYYDDVRQDILWIAENWQTGLDNADAMVMLGRDGRFDAAARYDLRKLLARMDWENNVAVIRAHSLAAKLASRGVALTTEDRAVFAERIARARQYNGECVQGIDPLTLASVPPGGKGGAGN